MPALEVDAVLLDLEGVLGVGGVEAIPGAPEAIDRLRRASVPFRVVTNTTTVSRKTLAREVRSMGLDVRPEELHTAPVATADYLRQHHRDQPVFLLAKGDTAGDFEGIDLVEEGAGVVVVGGAEERFTYDAMNRAYRMLDAGASLVAMCRSTSWMTDEGLKLDAGPYVAALEEAAGVRAMVCGKPAETFFTGALSHIGVRPDRAAMVGDDVVTDVLAAQSAGLTGVLVRTGKFRPADLDRHVGPDHVIDSVADLPDLLGID
ncbi:MAG TPA: TIGR01458 family HAD-type hydrolase [Actinomycetota bacterium]|nr:TIGR01458 family HAD-type hydrolase [Actinomycetota bacterium]